MARKPEYEGIRAGDIIELPEGQWYVEGVRYVPGASDPAPRFEGTYSEYQTDNLALNLRRVNIVEDDRA